MLTTWLQDWLLITRFYLEELEVSNNMTATVCSNQHITHPVVVVAGLVSIMKYSLFYVEPLIVE